ncbi:uncharacterized protein A4U43_C07F30720 [Asparagus officinalis]|uniref:TF-B3 domain-containing protein n=1 Tax=Asparagus officinalis TaxID=4686 RepID=A0A5P1EJ94_ASPOF|nr:putative B3 domain-containing protein Os03g0621600 [Asparagus officinalis]ONK64859.1 uncharacterized protein A4U43_C07F30720 [Asparagus officinalis]
MGKPKLLSMATPSFFKVMFGDFRTSLRIPTCFEKHFGEKPMRRSVLRSSAGRKWEIKMGTVGDQVFFQDGWGRFISDNSINFGDFLVFFYDGDVGFDVKIYGATCCEKAVEFEVKIEAESESECSDYKSPVNPGSDPLKVGRNKKARKSKEITAEKSKMCYKVIRGAKVSDKAIKAACSFRSPHPHFVTSCRSSPTFYMRIPAELVKKCNLDVKNSIVLQDPRGTSWSIKLSTWGDGHLRLTSGWSRFYNKNHLKEGDACVLELVQGGATINVHIFRSAEYRTKSIPQSGERFLNVDDMRKVQHARKSMGSDNIKSERFLSIDVMKKVPKEAESFKSRHPTLVIVWRPSLFYRVNIPKKLAQELGLVKDQETILIDSSGKSWSADISVRTTGLVELGVGWSHFSRGNNLASGDVCIFEFFGGAEYIKVHIFRAGETNTAN